jgi:hypothetical protein
MSKHQPVRVVVRLAQLHVNIVLLARPQAVPEHLPEAVRLVRRQTLDDPLDYVDRLDLARVPLRVVTFSPTFR